MNDLGPNVRVKALIGRGSHALGEPAQSHVWIIEAPKSRGHHLLRPRIDRVSVRPIVGYKTEFDLKPICVMDSPGSQSSPVLISKGTDTPEAVDPFLAREEYCGVADNHHEVHV